MQPFQRRRRLTPPQVLVIGFAVTIIVGSFLLSLPIASEGESVPYLDALFTSTSAVCVTGLVVTDTARTYSTFGEWVIMLLIQVGGLGFMGFTTVFAVLLGKRIGVKERLVLREAYNQVKVGGVVQLVKYMVMIYVIFEGIGFLVLSVRWVPEFGWGKGAYYALFHTVSAFNNAGFDLFGDYQEFSSLTGFVTDPVVNGIITALFILGGIGFIVIVELYQYRWTGRFSLHTKLVLLTTIGLIFMGMSGIMLVEWSNPDTLGSLSTTDKLMASFFQGVTPRTAGFSTLNLPDLYPATHFLIMMLMFIGASPSSTGGRIKTTTFMAIVLAVWSMIRGRDDVSTFRRRIPHGQIYKALTIFVASMVLVIGMTMLLTITESSDVFHVFFEAVSAFGTVGLSLGMTPELSDLGKVLITLIMFVGRLGPMTIAFALAKRTVPPFYRYPEEEPLIG
ncbi:TrkH family potassium uptake protein [Paludifilum halophilum]|uniref:Trk family potassium uptake protein n=1 Tax=Paludifilum halophilum TaxID=1642702 RepID=A0A235B1N3_9BACL|nr:TrkH family potassium uptake protein [Paludifilum halophilum]OYD06152.1 Trk family potassium uptake protein [Paludifilum halophilum]